MDEFDIRFKPYGIKVTARFFSPEGFVMEGFDFDRTPGQREPGIVLIPGPAARNR